jgi:pimeloyl-ACP methyl ester carboxylesterase
MKTAITLLSTIALLAATVLTSGAASASPSGPGPLNLTGEINGAPFRIIVPESWNGKLIVFAHGYDDKADHPGEIDVRGAFPRQIIVTGTRAILLSEGWAVAGTAYKDNGWVVKDGLDDVVALTSYFKDNIAKPQRTYLWGFSMGGLVALKLAERNGGAFDGYIASCALGAGAPRFADSLLVTMLAYDVAFGEPASWGMPGDVRDDIDLESEVLPIVLGQILDPLNFGKFEFIRLIAGTPGRGLTPPLPPDLFLNWAFEAFGATTEGAAEAERRAGGPFMQNVTHRYELTPAEKAYLASLGVDADPLLNAMNARRTISAPPSSRNYMEHYAELDGTIKKPVLTLHSEIDWTVPVSHESAYTETVGAAGNADLLFQTYTTAVGHCEFNSTQLVTSANELDAWVQSGARPADADFPAGQGFDQSFVPPAWLQP